MARLLRPLIQPRLPNTYALAPEVSPGFYVLPVTTGAAAPEPPPPAADQTVLTVGVSELQYGYVGDEGVGAVLPTTLFGLSILYLYGRTDDSHMILKFAGDAQVPMVNTITMALTGGGLPPGPFDLTWNLGLRRYDALNAAAVNYLQGQLGNNVTVDVSHG